MPQRKIYSLNQNNQLQSTEQQFKWIKADGQMFSKASKQASANNFLNSIKRDHPNTKNLEVSSASKNPLGKQLSAFHLPIVTRHGSFKLENLYQASKQFDGKNLLSDVLKTRPRKTRTKYGMRTYKRQAFPWEAKKDARNEMKSHKLTGFKLGNNNYSLNPVGAFYNYIYTIALAEHPKLANQVRNYNSFTDFMAGKHTYNTQAQACAAYNSLANQGKLKESIKSYPAFIKNVYGPEATKKYQNQEANPNQDKKSYQQESNRSKPQNQVSRKSQSKGKSANRQHNYESIDQRKRKPSILDSSADAIINPVNTDGIVKTGVPQQLKLRHYKMYQEYRFFCYRTHDRNPKTGQFYKTSAIKQKDGKWKALYHGRGQGELQPGILLYYADKKKHQYIVNMPIKTDWRMSKHYKPTKDRKLIAHNQILNRNDQKQEAVNLKKGMNSLRKSYKKRNIKTIAVPKFDRNNGGLNWKQEKSIISKGLKGTDIKPIYYDQKAIPQPAKPKDPQITKSGAIDLNDENPFTSKPSRNKSAQVNTQQSVPKQNSKQKPKQHKAPIPNIDLVNTDEIQSLQNKLGKNYPQHFSISGDNKALFNDQPKIAVIGPRNIENDKKATQNLKKAVDILNKKGFTTVTGLGKGSDTVTERESLKNKAPMVTILASNFKFITPPSNRSLLEKSLDPKNKGFAMSPHKDSDYVDFKDGKTYRQRDRIISGLGDSVLITKANSKNGELQGNEIYAASYAHKYQHKQIYTIPENNTPETNQLLSDDLDAKNVKDVFSKDNEFAKEAYQNGASNDLGASDEDQTNDMAKAFGEAIQKQKANDTPQNTNNQLGQFESNPNDPNMSSLIKNEPRPNNDNDLTP